MLLAYTSEINCLTKFYKNHRTFEAETETWGLFIFHLLFIVFREFDVYSLHFRSTYLHNYCFLPKIQEVVFFLAGIICYKSACKLLHLQAQESACKCSNFGINDASFVYNALLELHSFLDTRPNVEIINKNTSRGGKTRSTLRQEEQLIIKRDFQSYVKSPIEFIYSALIFNSFSRFINT